MKILVTGGAGFIGSVLTPLLLGAGHEVTVVDVLRRGGQGLLACFHDRRFRFVRGDIRDREAMARLIATVDAVVHLAAIVGFPACRKYPELARDTNVEGTRTVAESMRNDQVLIYASSGSNYGIVEALCTENSPLNPTSFYAMTKTEGEKICLRHPRATALRFATAFGVSPRMRLDLMVNNFVHQAIVNKQLIVYEGHFRRTFIGVHDIARSILMAIEQIDRMSGEAYNVGHESMNFTKAQIALKIREYVPFYLHFADIGTDEDNRDYHVSYEKIQQLGYRTEVTIEDGIEELVRAMSVLDIIDPYSNV
jgi:nucleoside-diphosphate-sugar epimerase